MKTCDLHTHSHFSDGSLTPEELIDLAVNTGLSAVALTDHNTVDGIPSFLSAAKGKNIEAVAGAEFSVEYCGKELHLLGLFIPECECEKITGLMSDFLKLKEESYIGLINELNLSGYKIDFNKIKNSTPNGKFNRAHIAEELLHGGYVKSIKEAFSTLLSSKNGFYKPARRPDVFYMLEFLKEIHATPVLAHPFLNLTEQELCEFLPKAKEGGLVGMECYYSLYTKEQTETSITLANKFGLKYSGGSDFHGSVKPNIFLGTGKGDLCVPYSLVQELKPF